MLVRVAGDNDSGRGGPVEIRPSDRRSPTRSGAKQSSVGQRDARNEQRAGIGLDGGADDNRPQVVARRISHAFVVDAVRRGCRDRRRNRVENRGNLPGADDEFATAAAVRDDSRPVRQNSVLVRRQNRSKRANGRYRRRRPTAGIFHQQRKRHAEMEQVLGGVVYGGRLGKR